MKDEELQQLARELRARDSTIKEIAEKLSDTAEAAEAAASAAHALDGERRVACAEIERLSKESEKQMESSMLKVTACLCVFIEPLLPFYLLFPERILNNELLTFSCIVPCSFFGMIMILLLKKYNTKAYKERTIYPFNEEQVDDTNNLQTQTDPRRAIFLLLFHIFIYAALLLLLFWYVVSVPHATTNLNVLAILMVLESACI